MAWATINVRSIDGKTANITVENEGHCEATGAMLVAFYNSFNKAKELLKCGSLYQLEAKIPTKEFIDKVSEEVSTGDISNMPFYPYHFINLPDLDNEVKTAKLMRSAYDYVICRFLVENTTLPSFNIQNKKLVIYSSHDERHKVQKGSKQGEYTYIFDQKVQKGFRQGEYTYLFDQKENKWFLYGDNETEKYDLEALLQSDKSKWTAEKFIKEHEYYSKRLKKLVKRLQAEYQRRLDLQLRLKTNVNDIPKLVQAEVKVLHRPQSVRELNNWLRRMNVDGKLRVRTAQDRNYKYLAVQEFTTDHKWRTVRKCEQTDYNAVTSYLQQFVPVDWQYKIS